jgi:hypothetical protein
MEKKEWKPFRIALDKKERKKFERCLILLNSTSLLAPIPVSLYHFIPSSCRSVSSLQRAEGICIKQVEQIEARVNRSN